MAILLSLSACLFLLFCLRAMVIDNNFLLSSLDDSHDETSRLYRHIDELQKALSDRTIQTSDPGFYAGYADLRQDYEGN